MFIVYYIYVYCLYVCCLFQQGGDFFFLVNKLTFMKERVKKEERPLLKTWPFPRPVIRTKTTAKSISQ